MKQIEGKDMYFIWVKEGDNWIKKGENQNKDTIVSEYIKFMNKHFNYKSAPPNASSAEEVATKIPAA